MNITRRFTQAGRNVYDLFDYTLRSSVLRNPDGSVVFEMHNIEVPKGWSQVATDILAQKYFRKAGVPQLDAAGNPLTDESGNPVMGGEQSAKQVVHRLAGCWTQWGKDHGYFDTEEDAQAFYDENAYILLAQMAAPNSPQWFNTGLNYAYGITGPSQGHHYVDPVTGKLTKSKDAYTHPQPHACARGNTRLFTDAGILSIREIVESNRTDLKVFDGEQFVPIYAAINNGVRPIWRATLRNGNFIEFTDDHRIWSSDRRTKEGGEFGWHSLREILGWRVQQIAIPIADQKEENLNDLCMAIEGKPLNATTHGLRNILQNAAIEFSDDTSYDLSPSIIDSAKAALSGWIIGDGYYGKYNRNSKTTLFGAITINNDEFAFVTNLFQTLFNEYRVIARTNINENYRIVKLDKKIVDSFVEEYELNTTSYTAKVPEKIFSGTLQQKQLFLRSLFQADGCVRIRKNKNSGDIVLSTISEELAHGVQLLLLSMGIYSNISVSHDARKERKPVYQVSISFFSERKKYEKMIGFISREKKEKLIRLNNSIIGKQKAPLSEESVVSIEYIGEEEVFDIQTETSRFAANGVVVHNCFIQSVSDDLVNEGGIFDLITREARIFKYGSGTGSNFSHIRAEGEPLSGGGVSSGLMSFLKVADRAAGAVKSGGTTRRAAKMVILNADHPDIENFIDWKMIEEQKVADLVAGSKMNNLFLNEIMAVAARDGDDYTEPGTEIHDLVQRALNRGIPMSQIVRALALVKQGHTKADVATYNTHYEGEAYITVSGQNSNNSVRVTNKFMEAVEKDAPWNLVRRTDGKVVKTIGSRQLWQKINYAAWSCADPGLQFHTTVNEWHTSPKDGEINGSNPCSEYMFLDDTACNLASINLAKFYDAETRVFDVEGYKHACRILTIVLEVSVLMAQFPSKTIAQKSYDFRTLGLGYANIGTVLMTAGIPYDSDEGRAWAGALTAIMTGEAYATSAEMAGQLGSFPNYKRNDKDMLRVIRNHRRAAYNAPSYEYEGLTIKPVGINHSLCPNNLSDAAKETWDRALALGEQHGYRNAQVSVIAPTGTIALIMDCDTTGIEPDFAMVKFKKLAGGGYFKIVNSSVPAALRALGYSEAKIIEIERYIKGHGTLSGCPNINKQSLKEKGFSDENVQAIENQLDSVFDVKFAFNKWTLGEEFLRGIGFTQAELDDPSLNVLVRLGFTGQQIEEANKFICGTMTIEGAPGLNPEHLAVFDCANKCGKYGQRYIQHMGHVKMMAAAQPFISGAISKTINMPNHATIDEVAHVYMESWKLMLKAIALYRDGSKLSQPLNSTADTDLVEEITLRDASVEPTQMIGDENTWDENVGAAQVHERIVEKVYHRADRRRLPKRRHGFVREATVGGHKVFIRTGEYEDGTLGEIFIDMYKEGASFKGLLNCFAVLASKALQYGMPLEKMVDTFTFTRFEPSGPVFGHEAIKSSTSIIDYVFRALGYEYLGREDFIHVKAIDEGGNTEPKTGINGKGGSQGNGNGNGQKLSPGQSLYARQVRAIDTPTVAPPIKPMGENQKKVQTAKAQGYTGEQCGNCGSMRVRQNGTCHVCEDCGTTSGCS